MAQSLSRTGGSDSGPPPPGPPTNLSIAMSYRAQPSGIPLALPGAEHSTRGNREGERSMRRLSFGVVLLALSVTASAFAAPNPRAAWPSLDQQLRKDRVEPGSALEQFIQANQDFQLLRAEEASDK